MLRIEELVTRARDGDRDALESLVRAVQNRVYNLAIRMLGDPIDAQDAAQEILVRVVTNLATFRGEAAFTTWVHKVATNYLLTTRKRRAEQAGMSFDALGDHIDRGLREADASDAVHPVEAIQAEEVRITCTQAMLLCLDRKHRLTYILGAIFEMESKEGADVLEITPAAFRQRLARARSSIEAFMKKRCGVFDRSNPCRCSVQVPYTVRVGMLDPERLRFADHPRQAHDQHSDALDEVVGLLDVAAVYRTHPDYATPEDFAQSLRDIIGS